MGRCACLCFSISSVFFLLNFKISTDISQIFSSRNFNFVERHANFVEFCEFRDIAVLLYMILIADAKSLKHEEGSRRA